MVSSSKVFLLRKPHGTSPKEKGLRALFSITKMTRMQHEHSSTTYTFCTEIIFKTNKPSIFHKNLQVVIDRCISSCKVTKKRPIENVSIFWAL